MGERPSGRDREHPNRTTYGHLVVGGALMTWIVVQVAILGPPVHWLQILYAIWGAAILLLALRHHRASR